VMVDTWVKAGESKFVYATNEIDALGKSDVINIKNPTHPLNVYTPYFFMQNGGNLIIKAANTSYITAQIGNNNNIVQVEKGAGLYIVPK